MPVKKASEPEKFIEKKLLKCYFSEEDTETTEFSGGGRFEQRKETAMLQPSVASSGFGKLTENGKYGSTAIQLYRKFYLGHRG